MIAPARVVAVAAAPGHGFSKATQPSIMLMAGLGIEGDVHAGETVKHRSRVAKDPTQPNLRQVHLIHAELFDELREKGFAVGPGDIGENITTQGVDLLSLPRGTQLQLGHDAFVRITGLRNPCVQLNGLAPGLMDAVLERDAAGRLIRKAGVMGVVEIGGMVKPGDRISPSLPARPHHRLEPV